MVILERERRPEKTCSLIDDRLGGMTKECSDREQEHNSWKIDDTLKHAQQFRFVLLFCFCFLASSTMRRDKREKHHKNPLF